MRRPGGGLLLLARGRGWSESTCGRLSKVASGSTFIGVDLRSTQRGRPRVGFNRSRPAVESARGRPRVDIDRSRPAPHCTQQRFRRLESVHPSTRGLRCALLDLSLRLNSLNGRVVGNRNSEPRSDATRSQRHRSKCALHRRGRANAARQPLPRARRRARDDADGRRSL